MSMSPDLRMIPPAKIKKEEVEEEEQEEEVPQPAQQSNVNSNEGMIRFEVELDKISKHKEGKFSPFVTVGGVPWRVHVRKEVDENGVAHIAEYLGTIENESPLWSIEVKAEHFLLNYGDDHKMKKRTDADPPLDCVFGHGTGDFIIAWDELINEKKGFVRNGKITLEVHFTVVKVIGFRNSPTIDFSTPRDGDVAFVINREKIYANPQILALHSVGFKEMFDNNPSQKVFALVDVVREEFVELLHLIYPLSQSKVTDVNMLYLLKLADRFRINVLIDQIERRIISSSKIGVAKKLLLSNQFNLAQLQGRCFRELQTLRELRDVEGSSEYAQLTDGIKAVIQRKITAFY